MLPFFRSPWFAISTALLSVMLGLFLPGDRIWLFGLAGTAALWSFIDWLGTNSERRRSHR
jgi:hypothetical protein